MPVTQGALDPKQREKIRVNLTYIYDQMDVTTFLDYCVNVELLTITEVIEIFDDKQHSTRKDKNRRFIDLLKRSGDRAYDKFLTLLKQHGGVHIAEKVDNTVVDAVGVQESGGASASLQLSEKQKVCRLTTKDLLPFAACVAVTNIHGIGMALGLDKNEIDTIIIDYHVHGVKTQRLYMFNKWLSKQGKAGTIQALVECFKDAEFADIKVDWDMVQKAVEKVKSAC